MTPCVSIVMPTYNRLERLKAVLGALGRQTYPSSAFEVIIVSDGCTDGTDAYLQALQPPFTLHFLQQRNQGPAAARNLGVTCARGEIVLFLDDDVVPCPELVAEHMRVHEGSPGDLIVLGPMLMPRDYRLEPWVRWEQEMLGKQYDHMLQGHWAPTARQFYTGNTSLARAHLLAAGGFDPHFRRAEDVELAYRLAERGLRFVFVPQAIGYHYAQRSLESWLEIPYLYGRNDLIFARDKGHRWLLPTILYEFQGRHALVRALTRLCLGRARLSRLAIAGLRGVAALTDSFGLTRPARLAYSGIFNLRYYQGLAEGLGGRDRFFALVAQAAPQAAQEKI